MIFVFHKNSVGFDERKQFDIRKCYNISSNDVCLVLQLLDANKNERSLILHTKHGLIWAFLDDERGYFI